MKPSTSLKRGLAAVHRAWRAGRYDRALAEVTRLREQWPDNPRLLVAWANLVQLQDTDTGPTLADAGAALERAVELDDESPATWIERGHFLNAVEDDAGAALKCFARAVVLCKQLLKEALLSQAKVLTELDRRAEALACLAEAYWLQSFNRKPGSNGNGEEILERLNELAGSQSRGA